VQKFMSSSTSDVLEQAAENKNPFLISATFVPGCVDGWGSAKNRQASPPQSEPERLSETDVPA